MILEFKTKRTLNGNRKYLYIDTGAEYYSTECPRMLIEGIEISTKGYRELIDKCKRLEYKCGNIY